MITDCKTWNLERPPSKDNPSEDDLIEFYAAMRAHIAVCERCQRDEKLDKERYGSMIDASGALVCDLVEDVIREMRTTGLDVRDGPIVHFAVTHTLMVAERWKIIKFDESMLAVRNEASMKRHESKEVK